MALRLSTGDAALLSRQFQIADPRTVENLGSTVPTRGDVPIVEYSYDVTPPKGVPDRRPDVWCAHCQKFNHWIGYVMLHQDGTRFLCGHDCGEKIYGIAFKEIENRFKADADRQGWLRRLQATLPRMPALVAAVRNLSQDSAYRTLSQLQREFEYRMPALYDALVQVAKQKNNPGLNVVSEVRDYKAEDARRDRNIDRRKERQGLSQQEIRKLRHSRKIEAMEDESKPIYRNELQWLGHFDGAILFNKNIERQARTFNELADKLLNIYTRFINRETDGIRKREISQGFRDLEAILGEVKGLLKELAAAQDFFAATHLDRVARWATNTYECGGGFRDEKGALVFSPRGDDTDNVTIRLPASFTLPTIGFVHEFERSVSTSLGVAA